MRPAGIAQNKQRVYSALLVLRHKRSQRRLLEIRVKYQVLFLVHSSAALVMTDSARSSRTRPEEGKRDEEKESNFDLLVLLPHLPPLESRISRPRRPLVLNSETPRHPSPLELKNYKWNFCTCKLGRKKKKCKNLEGIP